jgi:hypothetical protein
MVVMSGAKTERRNRAAYTAALTARPVSIHAISCRATGMPRFAPRKLSTRATEAATGTAAVRPGIQLDIKARKFRFM